MTKQQTTRVSWPASVRGCVGGLLLITMLLLVACGRSVAGQPQPVGDAAGTAQPTNSATPTLDIYETYGDKQLITRLEESLTAPGLSAEDRQLIEEGIAYQQQHAERRATAVAQGSTRLRAGDSGDAAFGRPTTTPGITAMDMDEPHPFSGVIAANVWHDYDGDTVMIVQAGGRGNDPDQGVVAVLNSSVKYGGIGTEGIYNTPTRSGSVRIITERNWQLTLEAENGDLFVFDVEAREFVDDPLAPTPTGTPEAVE